MEVSSVLKEDKGVTIVSVNGRIDSYTYNIFENEVYTNIDIGQQKMILDFTDVSYISSQGLRTLVTALKKAKAQSGFIKLCGLNESVLKILKVSGLDKALAIFPDADTALNS
ncbi:MAG TPA: STAS domain-containing protein [bacterium]|nr:STAS domain-containing protein [bacterium]HPN30732.1 STAS domain-containing protein [bacterium]